MVIDMLEPFLEQFEQYLNVIPPKTRRYKALSNLKEDIMKYLNQIPTLGFNSKTYDLPLSLSELAAYHLEHDEKAPFILRRQNKYIGILTDNFRFLDMTNYLSLGISYDGYLKMFGSNKRKFYSPYEYFTNFKVLKETTLPPHSAFYSALKGTNITTNEYVFYQKTWEAEQMKSMKDYLSYYNTRRARTCGY